MKLILYMVQSADGVAAKDERTDIRAWSSAEDHEFFLRNVRNCDAAVMGSRSWNPDVVCKRKYVLSRHSGKERYDAQTVVVSGSAEEIYSRIAGDGNQTAALLGGPTTNSAFLNAGLVDEIYLTVEPVLLGTGLRISSGELVSGFHLIETIRLNQRGTIVLRYGREPKEWTQERWQRILENRSFLEAVQRIEQSEENRRFCKHDLGHFLDTARMMYLITLEQGLPFTKDLVYGAGLLHDIGRDPRSGGEGSHAQAGLPAARTILEECGYTEEETGEILQAVAAHSGNRGTVLPMNLAELLYYADKAGRRCFRCEVREDCYWPEDMKNNSLFF